LEERHAIDKGNARRLLKLAWQVGRRQKGPGKRAGKLFAGKAKTGSINKKGDNQSKQTKEECICAANYY